MNRLSAFGSLEWSTVIAGAPEGRVSHGVESSFLISRGIAARGPVLPVEGRLGASETRPAGGPVRRRRPSLLAGNPGEHPAPLPPPPQAPAGAAREGGGGGLWGRGKGGASTNNSG